MLLDYRIRLFTFAVFVCLFFDSNAQSPFGINYQAIARDPNTGSVFAADDVQLRFEIRVGEINGQTIYREEHSVTTNDFGLFSTIIGQGTPLLGDFASLNWSMGEFFIATFVNDGAGFAEISAVQLFSVPYALHANTVSNPDDADADPENEHNLALDFNNNILSITDLGGALEVDLSDLNDADGDAQNESITQFELNGFQLDVTESGQTYNVDFANIIPSTFWIENGNGGLYHAGNTMVGIGEGNSVPSSTLDVNGSISYNTRVVNPGGTIVVQESDSHILINNTPNQSVSITLPSSVGILGREYVFIFRNTTNHSIEFLTADGTSIDDAPEKTFSPSHGQQAFSLVSFGSIGWFFTSGL